MKVIPVNGALGARIEGVNLSAPLSNAERDGILDAFYSYHVIVFPNQDLTPEQQVRFTELLGPALPHPLSTRRTIEDWPQVLVLENRPGLRGAPNDYWHSDISHMKTPPLASLLHAREIPEGRGDTMFSNMCAAYDDLSDGLKTTLSELRALHSGEATRARAAAERSDALPIQDVPPPTSHPVVRHLPEKDRRALFVNPHFTTGFEGMTREESAPLMNQLIAGATRPENVYRHRWNAGDFLVWDNRAVMHYAVRDYDEAMVRLMHRTTAGGPVPS